MWEVLQDIEDLWPASNPEHESLERLDDRGIEVGARLLIRERIAGIPDEATGEITELEPLSRVTWEAPAARYRWFGVPLTIGEGVTWALAGDDRSTLLSAHVWATFPASPLGRILGWMFEKPLKGIEKDREHARTELRYLKRRIEAPQTSGQAEERPLA